MAVSFLWRLLTVPWVGLQCVIVVFPGHTRLHSVVIKARYVPNMKLLQTCTGYILCICSVVNVQDNGKNVA